MDSTKILISSAVAVSQILYEILSVCQRLAVLFGKDSTTVRVVLDTHSTICIYGLFDEFVELPLTSFESDSIDIDECTDAIIDFIKRSITE